MFIISGPDTNFSNVPLYSVFQEIKNINEEVVQYRTMESHNAPPSSEDHTNTVSQPSTLTDAFTNPSDKTPCDALLQPETEDRLDDISLTHEELLKVTSSTLNELLKNDPIMHDLPDDVTVEEVEALTAVLHGQAITVYVKRGDNDDIPVIVSSEPCYSLYYRLYISLNELFLQVKQKDSRVSDLKRAFKRAMILKLRREGERYKISWKHVWRVYSLVCDGCKLDNDNGLLKDYGVVNKSKVNFVPKIKEKSRKFRKQ